MKTLATSKPTTAPPPSTPNRRIAYGHATVPLFRSGTVSRQDARRTSTSLPSTPLFGSPGPEQKPSFNALDERVDHRTIESFYDQNGTQYSDRRIHTGLLFNDYIEQPALISLFREVEQHAPIDRVLDIGCGPGVYAKYMAQAGKSVVALDISSVMVNCARDFCAHELAAEHYRNVQFLHNSFEAYEADSGDFSLILATFMLSYFSDLGWFFRKIAGMLRSDGKVIASMLHPVRMFGTIVRQPHSEYYAVSDYFSNGYYGSDFMDDNNVLRLKRWNMQDVTAATFDSGLVVDRVLEPRLEVAPPHSAEAVTFYEHNPSIVVFMLGKRRV
ncbi:MAG: methyltransferase domain-containing protein [Rhodospirillaceae bacterium]|nr:methyltransferase domain-containing protein [Rhodospirillaceae bacterium]